MVGGLITLMIVLAVASAAGFAVRRRQGKFRAQQPRSGQPAAGGTGQPRSPGAEGPGAEGPGAEGEGAAHAAPPGNTLSPADLEAPLGAQATLVQFSTEVCAYCGPTRELLAAVARERDGVAFVEIDAAHRMDLTRRLHVMTTPTVLVLDAAGGIASRASGPVSRAGLTEALGNVLAGAGPAR